MKIQPFQVRDSNTPMLVSAVLEAGGELMECIHVKGNLESTVSQMAAAVKKECDIILCSGGVSVGLHDHVK